MTETPRSAGTKTRTSHNRSAIFLERTEKGPCQLEELWNCFKGDVGERSEGRGGAPMGFSERLHTV